MSFWLAAAALAVAAVALVLLPTRRGDPAASARTDHLRRIAEFETDLALAEIAAEDADAARAEIERSVLRNSEAAATVEATAGRARFGAWLAALSVPLVAAAIYATLGTMAGELPSWNFGKYVISKDGTRVRYFGPRTAPDDADLRAAIEEELGAGS